MVRAVALRAGLLATVLGAVPALYLSAQSCTTLNPPCPANQPPEAGLFPATGTVFTTATVSITISIHDDGPLDPADLTVQATGMTFVSGGEVSGSWSSGSVTLVYQYQLSAGSGNTISVTICDPQDLCSSAAQATYTYTPLPPPPPQSTPIVVATPHNGENETPGLLDLTLAYSTPAYVSRDAARAVTLVYARALEVGEAIVQVDALDNSQTAPTQMSIRVRRGGTYETLLGMAGSPTEQFYVGAIGTSRLAARFSTTALTLGAYDDTAVVTSIWTGGPSLQATAPVRVLVARDTTSPYGRGWGIAGLQRVDSTNGGVVLGRGDGSIAFFRKTCPTCTSYDTPKGDFTVLTRLPATGWRRVWPNGDTASFDTQGRLIRVADRHGNRTAYAYDGTSRRLLTITDPANLVTTLSYDVAGKLDSIRDPGNRTTQVTVNGAGDLTEIFDPDGVRAIRVTYVNHVPVFSEPRTGGRVDYVLDAVGKLKADSLPQITTDAGLKRPTVRYRSSEIQLLPDGSGPGTSGSPLPRRDPATLRAAVFAPNGDSTVYAFNRFGQPTIAAFQHPTGGWRTATTTYNDHGQALATTTPEQSIVEYTWTGPDLTRVVDHATGQLTELTYATAFHQLDSVKVNGEPMQTHYYHPTTARLDSTKVGASKTTFTWDASGRPLSRTDPSGHVASLTYHATGTQNTHRVIAPQGGGAVDTATFTYDGHGRVSVVTDPAGRQATTTYDLLNRVDSTMAPGNLRVKFGYNDAMRTYTIRDPKLQVYTTVRNALGWVDTLRDARNFAERFVYDVNGNVKTYTNRRNQAVQFTYDQFNRVLTRTASGQTTTWSYNPVGLWVAVSNSESADTVKLDAKRRPTSATIWRNGVRYLVSSTYTDEGQRNTAAVSRTLTSQWTTDFAFGYDNLLRLNYLRGFVTNGTSVTYTSEHQPFQVTLPTGTSEASRLKETLTYTPAHLVSALTFNQIPAQTALGRRYSVDGLNRIATASRGWETDSTVRTVQYDTPGRVWKYADVHHWEEQGAFICPDPYDLSQCYYEIIPHADTVRQATFTYDSAGNRTDLGAVIQNGNRTTSFDGFTLTYDDDGNVLTKTKAGWNQTFTWNALSQLTQVVTNGVTTTYGYDGFGRRVRKTVGGTVTRYLHDGDDLIVELDAAGNRVREYAYYPGVDRPHSVRRSSDGAVFYYTTELPGHVAGLVNASNAVVNKYEYTPWGETVTAVEGVAQPLRYTAREWDVESQLYYYRARYYDPKLGRFLSEDPIHLQGGLNEYIYARNNPVNSRDPMGTCPPGTELAEVWLITYKDGRQELLAICVQTGGYDLEPITFSAPEWPFSTPRDRGAATNTGARGTDLFLHFVPDCGVYQDRGEDLLYSICARLSGPTAPVPNNCTAQCLLRDYVAAAGPAERLSAIEVTNYLAEHPSCYVRCRYTPAQFLGQSFGGGVGVGGWHLAPPTHGGFPADAASARWFPFSYR